MRDPLGLAAVRRTEADVVLGAVPHIAAASWWRGAAFTGTMACRADCPALLGALLDNYGLDVNSIDTISGGKTPLLHAAGTGSSRCVEVLLSRGADVNKAVTVVSLVKSPSGREHYVTWPLSPLYVAAQNGHVDVCRKLLDGGAALEWKGERDCTALHIAAGMGQTAVVKFLLERGADACATNVEGEHPILLACFNRHADTVKALMPHAKLRHLRKHGSSLLHVAAEFCGPAMLKLVLPLYVEEGIVDLPSGLNHLPSGSVGGRTALHLACVSAKYDEMKLLLEAGASRHAQDAALTTPLNFCVVGQSLACLREILGMAPNWHYTPEQLNEPDSRGYTILHTAILVGSSDVARQLLAAGADPTVKALRVPSDRVDGATCLEVVRFVWKDERPELAALFASGAVLEPLLPPCCSNCHKTNIKLSACAGCQYALYCSNACQRVHWNKHRLECRSPADLYKEHLARCEQRQLAKMERLNNTEPHQS
jgi:ankyrin repeat protein